MTHPHGAASACPSGNYLHGCDSSELISPRSSPADDHCRASRHGTAAAYRRGCRCPVARQAIARYEKQRLLERHRGHTRTLPNVGAVRRLQALRALGWPGRELARRIGVDERNMSRWPHRAWISRAHHDAVCRVYDELADTPGPDGRARRHAQRHGWLPPLAWDDDTIDDPRAQPGDDNEQTVIDTVAIERLLAGDTTIRLTRAEKTEAYQQLLARGVSHNQAAIRLGLSGTTARKLADPSTSTAQVVGARRDRGDDDMRSAAS